MPWKGDNEYRGLSEPQYRGPVRPNWDIEREKKFLRWYQGIAQSLGLNQNPDAPAHAYDYRGFWDVNPQAKPGPSLHFPSEFKYMNHPRRFMNGYDTATGGLAPMIMRWLEE